MPGCEGSTHSTDSWWPFFLSADNQLHFCWPGEMISGAWWQPVSVCSVGGGSNGRLLLFPTFFSLHLRFSTTSFPLHHFDNSWSTPSNGYYPIQYSNLNDYHQIIIIRRVVCCRSSRTIADITLTLLSESNEIWVQITINSMIKFSNTSAAYFRMSHANILSLSITIFISSNRPELLWYSYCFGWDGSLSAQRCRIHNGAPSLCAGVKCAFVRIFHKIL